MLTALGDGARRYVVDEFASLGTNLVIVLPGRTETGGINPANFVTSTPRDLTRRRRAGAAARAGRAARGAAGGRHGRELRSAAGCAKGMVVGSTAEFLEVRQFEMAQGQFLPREDWDRGSPVMVIGAKLRARAVRRRARRSASSCASATGASASSACSPPGSGLGMNTDELAIVPVAVAQAMFNTNTLFRILVEARNRDAIEPAKAQARDIIKARHDGEEDVTVITQDAMLATFDRLLGTLTLGVAGIAAISLAVAGILVMNVMLVSVAQRTARSACSRRSAPAAARSAWRSWSRRRCCRPPARCSAMRWAWPARR